MRTAFFSTALALIATGLATADTITYDGQRHENVLVRESPTMYYVQDPATGTIANVAKDKVAPGAWQPTTDPAERQRLSDTWKAARERTHPTPKPIEAPKSQPAASAEQESDRAGTRLAGRGTDGRIPYLRLKNVPMRDALDATLRPLNLDYTTEGGFLYISTPQRIAQESLERIETRTYNVNLDQTLPKIVISNRFGGGFSGNNRGGGGFASGGAGGGSLGNSRGGNQGGFGQQGGFGAQGGNQGGFGAQGGNQGGFNNQNVRDVTAISNISQLFTNIDDRLVGESPAQIGIGIQTAR